MCAIDHQAETFAERRKFARYSLKLRVNYTAAEQATQHESHSKSITKDLGLGGIALVVHEELEIGKEIQVKIDLPSIQDLFSGDDENESLSAAEKTVNLLSKVAWCRPYEEGTFLIGVQFLDLEHEDVVLLKDFLEEYKLQDGKVDAA
jgi:c-di-GMP-binding flagellar brake protein YcgR